MMDSATLDDVIEAMAVVDGMRPDQITVGEFLIESPWGTDCIQPRAVAYRESPQVLQEAAQLLRQHQVLQVLFGRLDRAIAA